MNPMKLPSLFALLTATTSAFAANTAYPNTTYLCGEAGKIKLVFKRSNQIHFSQTLAHSHFSLQGQFKPFNGGIIPGGDMVYRGTVAAKPNRPNAEIPKVLKMATLLVSRDILNGLAHGKVTLSYPAYDQSSTYSCEKSTNAKTSQ